MNNQNSQLTKQERRELKQQEKETWRAKQERKRKARKFLSWGAGIVAIVLAIWGMVWIAQNSGSANPEQAATLLTVASDDYVQGPADAPVTLVEYLDFECEACGAYFSLIKKLEQEFPNDLRVVRRYFPLPSHRNSMTAALAAEAAARQVKYMEMHDLLFQEQKNWGEKPVPTPEVFEGFAEQLGLNMAQFRQDIKSQAAKDRIERDVDSGKKLGNTGIPAFFLNGEKIQNPRGYDDFKALIQAEIDKNK